MHTAILMQMELLFGSIGVTLSIFFGAILLYKKPRAISNIFLAIYLSTFGLRVGKSLFHNFFHFSPTLRTYLLSILFCVGPSLWLFVKYRTLAITQFHRHDDWHYALFLLFLPICWFIPNDGTSIWFAIFYNATIFHILGYTGFSLYWLNQPKEAALQKNQSVNNWLNTFLIANILMMISYFLISIPLIPFYLGIAFSYSIIIVIFGAWALKIPTLFELPLKKYLSSNFDEEQAVQLFQRLKTWLEAEKSFLDPDLTLAKLSQQIDATPKAVSQAINQVEQLNYSQFIAKFRVQEAQRLLKSPTHRHIKISVIAYDSGFNSISSFNAQFKKYTQLTAKAYRAAYLVT